MFQPVPKGSCVAVYHKSCTVSELPQIEAYIMAKTYQINSLSKATVGRSLLLHCIHFDPEDRGEKVTTAAQDQDKTEAVQKFNQGESKVSRTLRPKSHLRSHDLALHSVCSRILRFCLTVLFA